MTKKHKTNWKPILFCSLFFLQRNKFDPFEALIKFTKLVKHLWDRGEVGLMPDLHVFLFWLELFVTLALCVSAKIRGSAGLLRILFLSCVLISCVEWGGKRSEILTSCVEWGGNRSDILTSCVEWGGNRSQILTSCVKWGGNQSEILSSCVEWSGNYSKILTSCVEWGGNRSHILISCVEWGGNQSQVLTSCVEWGGNRSQIFTSCVEWGGDLLCCFNVCYSTCERQTFQQKTDCEHLFDMAHPQW